MFDLLLTMFSTLTVTELDELSNALDASAEDIKDEQPFKHKLLWEIEDIQHEVWHLRCLRSGDICHHDHAIVRPLCLTA